ncbi:MAG: glycosyltransferase family 39 protein [bacterium]|nr:glycosyltransferase family 39 protein [bacterium]
MSDFLKRHFLHISLAFVFSVYFFFGLQHIGKFITADEHYWIYERIPQYWDAWAESKWKRTLINDKPGITLALISGSGLLAVPAPEALCSRTEERIITCDTKKIESMLFAFRFPLLFINGLLILYLFWIIKKITNRQIALWSTCFIALSPILLGIAQIVNPDTLLWSFGAAALFSYFAAQKYEEKKYILLSGLFLGLALLSKYTASILIPFFLMIPIFFVLFSMPADNQTRSLRKIRRRLIVFALTVLIAIIVVILFLPAIWMKPLILQNLLSGGSEEPFIFFSLAFFALFSLDHLVLKSRVLLLFRTVIQKARTLGFFSYLLPWSMLFLFVILLMGRAIFPDWNLFATVPFDVKDLTSTYNGHLIAPNFLESLLLQANPLIFSLPPIVLLFFFIALFCIPLLKKTAGARSFEALMTFLFILVFIVLLIFLDVLATPRYIILLYPFAAFLAACGVWESKQYLKNKLSSKISLFRSRNTVIFVVIAAFSLISLVASQPFFFNYANGFLPKKSLISDAWGYGGYEAAQYLNGLPGAENLLVWSDYEGVCEFFVGKCMIKQYKYSSRQKIDYAVITRRGDILYNPNHSRWLKEGNLSMKQAYDDPDPDWLLEIDGRPENFIKVVKVEE